MKKSFVITLLTLFVVCISFSATSCSKDDDEVVEEQESSSSATDDAYEYVGTISAIRIYHTGSKYYKKSDTLAKFRLGSKYYYAIGKKSTDKRLASKNTQKMVHGIDVSSYKYCCDFGVLGDFYFN